jgi:hypothetical protein
VASCCEYGDELASSGATELVRQLVIKIFKCLIVRRFVGLVAVSAVG